MNTCVSCLFKLGQHFSGLFPLLCEFIVIINQVPCTGLFFVLIIINTSINYKHCIVFICYILVYVKSSGNDPRVHVVKLIAY